MLPVEGAVPALRADGPQGGAHSWSFFVFFCVKGAKTVKHTKESQSEHSDGLFHLQGLWSTRYKKTLAPSSILHLLYFAEGGGSILLRVASICIDCPRLTSHSIGIVPAVQLAARRVGNPDLPKSTGLGDRASTTPSTPKFPRFRAEGPFPCSRLSMPPQPGWYEGGTTNRAQMCGKCLFPEDKALQSRAFQAPGASEREFLFLTLFCWGGGGGGTKTRGLAALKSRSGLDSRNEAGHQRGRRPLLQRVRSGGAAWASEFRLAPGAFHLNQV